MRNLEGIYWLLVTLPISATVPLLLFIGLGMIFLIRTLCEGLFYNTSYSAVLGYIALFAIALIGVEKLKFDPSVKPPDWIRDWPSQILFIFIGIGAGVLLWLVSPPKQWGDRYHHAVVLPLLIYLGFALLPIIWQYGTLVELVSTALCIFLWIMLVVYDAATGRLNQRNFRTLGKYLDIIKNGPRHRTVESGILKTLG